MDLRKIKKLIDMVEESGISRTRSAQRRGVDPHLASACAEARGVGARREGGSARDTPAARASRGFMVRAPLTGTFYCAPAPGERPFVRVGQTVAVGDVLCIIESMKMMNQIEAERAGRIARGVGGRRNAGRNRRAAVPHRVARMAWLSIRLSLPRRGSKRSATLLTEAGALSITLRDAGGRAGIGAGTRRDAAVAAGRTRRAVSARRRSGGSSRATRRRSWAGRSNMRPSTCASSKTRTGRRRGAITRSNIVSATGCGCFRGMRLRHAAQWRCCGSIRALRSAPAVTRRPRCVSNGSHGTTSMAGRSSTTAPDREFSASPRCCSGAVVRRGGRPRSAGAPRDARERHLQWRRFATAEDLRAR